MRFSAADFPVGQLVELCGLCLPPGGRAWLSLCLRRPRNVSRRARSLMSPDSLDPLSLAAAGVELPRLLWVRWRRNRGPRTGSQDVFLLCPCRKRNRKTGGSDSANKKSMPVHGWRHPRELMRGVDQAIPSLIGKQGAVAESAQIHVVARCAGEHVERDREPPRRGFRPPRSLPSLR